MTTDTTSVHHTTESYFKSNLIDKQSIDPKKDEQLIVKRTTKDNDLMIKKCNDNHFCPNLTSKNESQLQLSRQPKLSSSFTSSSSSSSSSSSPSSYTFQSPTQNPNLTPHVCAMTTTTTVSTTAQTTAIITTTTTLSLLTPSPTPSPQLSSPSPSSGSLQMGKITLPTITLSDLSLDIKTKSIEATLIPLVMQVSQCFISSCKYVLTTNC